MPHSTAVWDYALPPPTATPNDGNNIISTYTNPPFATTSTPPVEDRDNIHSAGTCTCVTPDNSELGLFRRRQSTQHSSLAKQAIMASKDNMSNDHNGGEQHRKKSIDDKMDELRNELDRTLSLQPTPRADRNGIDTFQFEGSSMSKPIPAPSSARAQRAGSLAAAMKGQLPEVTGASIAMNDTPATTAPNSPRMKGDYFPQQSSDGERPIMLPTPIRQNSGTSTPRVRPTTLDIPGLTKSKVSPDGRIAQRDVGAKLVIVMVGLPARGKSYITKKLARYLNWLQHDTKIFNVGERRRVVAGGPNSLEKTRSQQVRDEGKSPNMQPSDINDQKLSSAQEPQKPVSAAQIILNGETRLEPPATPPPSATITQPAQSQFHGNTNHDREGSRDIGMPDMGEPKNLEVKRKREEEEKEEAMKHNSAFFDPENKKASQIREQVARETLDELLDYILNKNGSVGILDATNSTMERRKMVMDRIRERAGPDLNVLFLESSCVDQDLLEANIRLKLNGPDYRDMDPTVALEDFKKRIQVYEKAYVPLGEYEEKNNMPYIQMVDVGRKIISHQIRGFLSAQANYYLLNFNLAPRQIWITRHGLSEDNISGKIGGDSDLAPEGHKYAQSLAKFMDEKRKEWDEKQIENLRKTHFPPQPGDVTPPNPYYNPSSPTSERNPGEETASDSGSTDARLPEYEPKAFCVWTSMLKRSIQTAQYFNDEDYDTKQMRMLDELNSGVMEGLTYSCISTQYPEEYRSRKADKLHYRYPGPGGEGYLDIINRLRPVIVELERMTDHVLLVGHRSVARVLLAYFRGLKREEVADLDVPLGMLYCLEPKPYGVDFKAYRWHRETEWFREMPDFQLVRAKDDMQ